MRRLRVSALAGLLLLALAGAVASCTNPAGNSDSA